MRLLHLKVRYEGQLLFEITYVGYEYDLENGRVIRKAFIFYEENGGLNSCNM